MAGKEKIFLQKKIIGINIGENNLAIAFIVLCAKKEKNVSAYVSKQNSNREKQWFNDSKCRRMVLSYSKKLSALLRIVTSKQHGDFYGLSCFPYFATENKCESHKKSCKN